MNDWLPPKLVMEGVIQWKLRYGWLWMTDGYALQSSPIHLNVALHSPHQRNSSTIVVRLTNRSSRSSRHLSTFSQFFRIKNSEFVWNLLLFSRLSHLSRWQNNLNFTWIHLWHTFNRSSQIRHKRSARRRTRNCLLMEDLCCYSAKNFIHFVHDPLSRLNVTRSFAIAGGHSEWNWLKKMSQRRKNWSFIRLNCPRQRYWKSTVHSSHLTLDFAFLACKWKIHLDSRADKEQNESRTK